MYSVEGDRSSMLVNVYGDAGFLCYDVTIPERVR